MSRQTVEVGFAEGPYAGWRATVDITSFPFKLVRDLQSGDLERIEAVCRRLVVEIRHEDEPLELDEADLFAVIALLDAAIRSRTALPNR